MDGNTKETSPVKSKNRQLNPGDLVDIGVPWHGHLFREVPKSRSNRKGLVAMMALKESNPGVYLGDAPPIKMRFEGPYSRVVLDGQLYWVHKRHVKVLSKQRRTQHSDTVQFSHS
jgi:hypothetical protein